MEIPVEMKRRSFNAILSESFGDRVGDSLGR
jgi:hypothetical protein